MKTIRIITMHSGQASRNGGEYGFWKDLIPDGDVYEVYYDTTAEFPYCTFCGAFGNGSEWSCCEAQREYMSKEEVEELLRQYPVEDEDEEMIYLNATGHPWTPHAPKMMKSGCAICWP